MFGRRSKENKADRDFARAVVRGDVAYANDPGELDLGDRDFPPYTPEEEKMLPIYALRAIAAMREHDALKGAAEPYED